MTFAPPRGMPQAACALIVRPNDGKVLAVSRKYDLSKFGLPGGKLDLGETPREAAIRETLEETGLAIELVCFLHGDVCEGEVPHYTWTYFATIKESKGPSEEVGRVLWVPWRRLFEGPFGEYNRHVFEAFKERARAPATRSGLLKMRR